MKMDNPGDFLMSMATSMHDSSRSGSNYGKLFLLNEIIAILQTKKKEIKEDIKKNSKFPQVEIERKNKRRNYFIEMLRYCELVVKQVKKYLN